MGGGETLLSACRQHGMPIENNELEEVVASPHRASRGRCTRVATSSFFRKTESGSRNTCRWNSSSFQMNA